MNQTKHQLIIEAILSKDKSYLKFSAKVLFGIAFLLLNIGLISDEQISFGGAIPSILFNGVFSAFLAVIFYAFSYLIFLIHSQIIKYCVTRQEIIHVDVETYSHWMKFYQYFSIKLLNGKLIKPYVVRTPVVTSEETKKGYLIKSPFFHYFFPLEYLDQSYVK